MSYVIAAYGLVAGALATYGVKLARERAALRKALAKSPSAGTNRDAG